MKPNHLPLFATVSASCLLLLTFPARAATTIDPANKYAYGANVGWMDFRGDTNNGVVIGEFVCSGYLYAANVGWISLSNAVAFVQTDTIAPGTDSNGDGIPDAWQLQNFGTINIDPNADPDHDGMSNRQEYFAGTNPNNPLDYLKITSESFGTGGTTATLTWNSVLTRQYYIEKTLNLGASPWTDSGLGLLLPAGVSTSGTLSDTNAPIRLYRVRAVRPLAP